MTGKEASKASVAKGSKKKDHQQSFWYGICQKYANGKYSSHLSFLCSKDYGNEVTEKNQHAFNGALTKFKAGTLEDKDKK